MYVGAVTVILRTKVLRVKSQDAYVCVRVWDTGVFLDPTIIQIAFRYVGLFIA